MALRDKSNPYKTFWVATADVNTKVLFFCSNVCKVVVSKAGAEDANSQGRYVPIVTAVGSSKQGDTSPSPASTPRGSRLNPPHRKCAQNDSKSRSGTREEKLRCGGPRGKRRQATASCC